MIEYERKVLQRLNMINGGSSTSAIAPDKHLDEIYITVLKARECQKTWLGITAIEVEPEHKFRVMPFPVSYMASTLALVVLLYRRILAGNSALSVYG